MELVARKEENINKLTTFTKANVVLKEAQQTIDSLNEFLTNMAIANICNMMDWDKKSFTFDKISKDILHDEYCICIYPKCDISRWVFRVDVTNESMNVTLKFRVDESKHY